MQPIQQRFWPDPRPLVERLGREFFRRVPECPGVYLMHGMADAVLYVGKALNLRHRLILIRFQDEPNSARISAWQDHAGLIHCW